MKAIQKLEGIQKHITLGRISFALTFLCLPLLSMTQTKTEEIIIDNLCKKWLLDTIEIIDLKKRFTPPDSIKSNYLDFKKDGTYQGQDRKTIIKGKWELDFKTMQITTYGKDRSILRERKVLTIVYLSDIGLALTSSPVLVNQVATHYKPDKRQNSYIITMSNDTIPGNIVLREDIVSLREGPMLKIDFQNEIDKKYYTFRADKIKGFYYDNRFHENVFYESLILEDMHFYFERIVQGRLSLYKSTYKSRNSNGWLENITEYFITEKSALIRVKEINFRKLLTAHVEDCPELAKKIDSKELRFENLREIVEEYNVCSK